MASTVQTWCDTKEEAQREVKKWRDAGFPARFRVNFNHYEVLVGSFKDFYRKQRSSINRSRGKLYCNRSK